MMQPCDNVSRGSEMMRVRRWLGLAVVSLAVATSAAMTGAASEEPPVGPPGRLIRVAQKPKVAKKVRNKSAKAEDAAKPEGEAAPATTAAASDDGLKFSRDIAPILVANCGDC